MPAGTDDVDRRGSIALRRTSTALVLTVWTSSLLFGAYILAFYVGAVADRDLPSWNGVLPRLYEPTTPAATVAMGVHLAAGGIIVTLGFVQLIRPLRDRHPAVHRGIGRVYVTASLLAGVGGLVFIGLKGTVGGSVMSLGFGLYGVLVVLCAVQAYRHARARRIDLHRAWALRLFALMVGSWLYRMDYGFWQLLTGGAFSTDDFRGPFDRVMAFAFYAPNLVLVELVVRGRRTAASPALRYAGVGVLIVTTALLLLGTYFFTTEFWGPAIVRRLTD